MTGENQPLTDEERRLDAEITERARREILEAMRRPASPVTSPGKFTEPLGMDEHGRPQPPLTDEERAHNEQVRERGRRDEA